MNMKKIHVGITGAGGFIGGHLNGLLRVDPDFVVVDFERGFFNNPEAMLQFVGQCNVIVHLAGMSRCENTQLLYNTNIHLSNAIADAVKKMGKSGEPPRILFGSTVHIDRNLPYHASKRESQNILENSGSEVITMLMPNAFGPYSRPFFNSVVSTFCHLIANEATPDTIDNATLKLADVFYLTRKIRSLICSPDTSTCQTTIPHQYEITLPDLWEKLVSLRSQLKNKTAPSGFSPLDAVLLETLKSYIR